MFDLHTCVVRKPRLTANPQKQGRENGITC
jgi:hypothetical protein